jgi:hypothetical protein
MKRLLFVLSLATVFSAAAPRYALAQTGNISGTVTDANTAAAISGVSVQVFSSTGAFAGAATSEASGNFTISTLPAGTYYARTFVTSTQNYIDELFDNVPVSGFCSVVAGTPITVTAGTTRSGVNFALSPGGGISGTVTDAVSAAGLSVPVQVYNANGQLVKTAVGSAAGAYSVVGLTAGTYYAKTAVSGGANYVDEAWDNIPCLNCNPATQGGAPISVTLGAIQGGINFALAAGGRISGTITDGTTGTGIVGAFVIVYFSSTTPNIFGATTTTGGAYTFQGLPAGTYLVRTSLSSNQNYVDEIYNNVPCPNSSCNLNSGTLVPVTSGATTSGINIALSAGGTISGTVTDAGTTAGVVGAIVAISNAAGQQVRSVATTTGGAYSATGLPTGNYFARTQVSSAAFNYLDKAYNNQPCFGCSVTASTPIAVTAGNTTSNINFGLTAGGVISGTITDTSSFAPIQSVTVQIVTSTGAAVDSRFGVTNASGVYTVGGLPTGAYFAFTSVSTTLNYPNEVYDNIPCNPNCNATSGVPIAVTAGSTHGGVDFGLTPGGTISGIVTDAATGSGIPSLTIQVVNTAGQTVRTTSTSTCPAGSYVIAGLPAGIYFIKTLVSSNLNYIDEVYDNKTCVGCLAAVTGTPISVTVGGTQSGINFALETGGRITGTITDQTTAAPLAAITVRVFSASGTSLKSIGTALDGTYALQGLPTGSYLVQATVPTIQNYIDELYDNITCLGCVVTSGTPVAVTAGSTHSNVNFGLAVGGMISGVVTDAGTGVPIPNVTVQAVNASLVGKSFSTAADGTYTIRGLPTGTYYARTFVPTNLNYIDELFDNSPCVPSCTVTNGTPIAVTAGATHTGVSFGLSPGATLSGTVTNASTAAPIANVTVQVFNTSNVQVRSAVTAANGTYTVTGLATGTYYARSAAGALNFIDKLYNNITCSPSCTPATGTAIALVTGVATSNINFALAPGGSVSGTVTDANTGLGIPSAQVCIVAPSNGSFVKCANSDGSGNYFVGGLLAGSYNARTALSPAQFYVDETYNNKTCCDNGTAFNVTLGATASNINFSLSPGGSISGAATDASTGLPISSGISMQIVTPTGFVYRTTGITSTGYAIGGLPPGQYYVRAVTIGTGLNYIDEVYNNAVCVNCPIATILASGTPVTVAAGAATNGINFALAAGGTIAGMVTNVAGGAGLAGISVIVSNAAMNKTTTTGANGAYSLTGLPTGTYFVRTQNASYVDELYNHIACPFSSCSPFLGNGVAVTAGSTTSNINFGLALGGAISGTITNSSTNAPVQGVTVNVFNTNGSRVRFATTGANGAYTVTGLPTGAYFVVTFSGALGLADEAWNNVPCPGGNCDPAPSNAVLVTNGATHSGINFVLDPAAPTVSGTITGTVNDSSTGLGIPGIVVQLFDSSGDLIATNQTFTSGSYTFQGFSFGDYYVSTFVPGGLFYLPKLYNNLACQGCNPTTGTKISLTAGVPTATGIDFALSSGAGSISGVVTDAATGAPITGTSIQIFNAAGTFVTSAGVNALGAWIIGGLTPGTYFARTVSGLNYVNRLFNNLPCAPACTVTTGTPIVVTAGSIHTGVNFALSPGSAKPIMPGRRTVFTLNSPSDRAWFSGNVVAGRSYCVPLHAAPTAQDAVDPNLRGFHANGVSITGTGECYIATTTETVLLQVSQNVSSARQYQFGIIETTLWSNWFFIGGDYSSFTLLHNTTPNPVSAVITWRSNSGAVVGSQVIAIAGGGQFAIDARNTVSGASSGSVEIAHDGPPEGLVGSQTTLSGSTGLSFDTLMLQRGR